MKIKEARRIMRLVAYGEGSGGRAWDGQDEAARVILHRLEKLESENIRLRREAEKLDRMSPEEIGEMLAGM